MEFDKLNIFSPVHITLISPTFSISSRLISADEQHVFKFSQECDDECERLGEVC